MRLKCLMTSLQICRSDMENYKQKYALFVTDLLFDIIENYRDINESNEDEVWKLGYREATDFVLNKMQEHDDFVLKRLRELLDQELKNKKENQ